MTATYGSKMTRKSNKSNKTCGIIEGIAGLLPGWAAVNAKSTMGCREKYVRCVGILAATQASLFPKSLDYVMNAEFPKGFLMLGIKRG